MIRLIHLTGEQPSDEEKNSTFITVSRSQQKSPLTFGMFLHRKPAFHLHTHVLASRLLLVCFTVEPGPAPAARCRWRRVQTVLSMTHALVWCVPADKHNGLCTQWRCLSGSPAGMQNMPRHFPTLSIVLLCELARCALPTPNVHHASQHHHHFTVLTCTLMKSSHFKKVSIS